MRKQLIARLKALRECPSRGVRDEIEIMRLEALLSKRKSA